MQSENADGGALREEQAAEARRMHEEHRAKIEAFRAEEESARRAMADRHHRQMTEAMEFLDDIGAGAGGAQGHGCFWRNIRYVFRLLFASN